MSGIERKEIEISLKWLQSEVPGDASAAPSILHPDADAPLFRLCEPGLNAIPPLIVFPPPLCPVDTGLCGLTGGSSPSVMWSRGSRSWRISRPELSGSYRIDECSERREISGFSRRVCTVAPSLAAKVEQCFPYLSVGAAFGYT